MMWVKLTFGGFGRRFVEALAALVVLAATSATVAASLMVVEGARNTLSRAIRQDRPDVVEVKSRFNRALFETPRTGNLPPLTIPVYEPLIDPAELDTAAGDNQVVKRQSLFRNVVSGDSFLNIYIFGIYPDVERGLSSFSLARGQQSLSSTKGQPARSEWTLVGLSRFGRRTVRISNSSSLAFSTNWSYGALRRDRLKHPR